MIVLVYFYFYCFQISSERFFSSIFKYNLFMKSKTALSYNYLEIKELSNLPIMKLAMHGLTVDL